MTGAQKPKAVRDTIKARAGSIVSIPARIAANVPELSRPVTASMGFVEQPSETMRADFARLYGTCDRLLYEAKAAGRNRTMSEKLTLFASGRGTHPKAA